MRKQALDSSLTTENLALLKICSKIVVRYH